MASEKDAHCVDDPNFAIICAFLDKFAPICGVEHPNVQEMQTMLEDMEEVAPELMDLHIKLMRKTKYTVRPDKWERSLVKFSHSFSNVDAWELEKFGYKKLRLPVRLRILKALLETQFDSNIRFKTAVNAIAANELRPLPLGRDKEGNAYWSTLDQKCNLRIYQEHLDEETWRVVATSRDELVKLIAILNGNEPIVPNLEGLVDEDSSSNSNNLLLKGEHVLVKRDSNSTSLSDDALLLKKKPEEDVKAEEPKEEITKEEPPSKVDEKPVEESSSEEEEEPTPEPAEKVPPQITKLEGHKNKYNKPSLVSSFAKKDPPMNLRTQRYSKRLAGSFREVEEEKLSIPEAVLKRPKVERLTLLGKSNLDKINKFKRMDAKKKTIVEDSSDDDEEEEEEDSEEEEVEEEESVDEEYSEPIEESVMIVKGMGSGKDCEGGNDVFECSEAIVEDTLYIFGEGSGADCDVGNTKDEEKSAAQSKPIFFFGQPGCLKLSPMKQNVTTEFGFGEKSEDDQGESSAGESSNFFEEKKNENCTEIKEESDTKADEEKSASEKCLKTPENDVPNDQTECSSTDVQKCIKEKLQEGSSTAKVLDEKELNESSAVSSENQRNQSEIKDDVSAMESTPEEDIPQEKITQEAVVLEKENTQKIEEIHLNEEEKRSRSEEAVTEKPKSSMETESKAIPEVPEHADIAESIAAPEECVADSNVTTKDIPKPEEEPLPMNTEPSDISSLELPAKESLLENAESPTQNEDVEMAKEDEMNTDPTDSSIKLSTEETSKNVELGKEEKVPQTFESSEVTEENEDTKMMMSEEEEKKLSAVEQCSTMEVDKVSVSVKPEKVHVDDKNLSESDLLLEDEITDNRDTQDGKIFTEEELLDDKCEVDSEKPESSLTNDNEVVKTRALEENLIETTAEVTNKVPAEVVTDISVTEDIAIENEPAVEEPSVVKEQPNEKSHVSNVEEEKSEDVDKSAEERGETPEVGQETDHSSCELSEQKQDDRVQDISLEKNLHDVDELQDRDVSFDVENVTQELANTDVLQEELLPEIPQSQVLKSEERFEEKEQVAAMDLKMHSTELSESASEGIVERKIVVDERISTENPSEDKKMPDEGRKSEKTESLLKFEAESQEESLKIEETKYKSNSNPQQIEAKDLTISDSHKVGESSCQEVTATPVLEISSKSLIESSNNVVEKRPVPETDCVPMELEELCPSQDVSDAEGHSASETTQESMKTENAVSGDCMPMDIEDETMENDTCASTCSQAEDLSVSRRDEVTIDETPMELEELENTSIPNVDTGGATLQVFESIPKREEKLLTSSKQNCEEVKEKLSISPQEENNIKVSSVVSETLKKPDVPQAKEIANVKTVKIASLEVQKEEISDVFQTKVPIAEDLTKSAPKESQNSKASASITTTKSDTKVDVAKPKLSQAKLNRDIEVLPRENLSAKADNNNDMKVSVTKSNKEERPLQISEVKTVVQAKTFIPECSAKDAEALDAVKKRKLSGDKLLTEKEIQGKRVKVAADVKKEKEKELVVAKEEVKVQNKKSVDVKEANKKKEVYQKNKPNDKKEIQVKESDKKGDSSKKKEVTEKNVETEKRDSIEKKIQALMKEATEKKIEADKKDASVKKPETRKQATGKKVEIAKKEEEKEEKVETVEKVLENKIDEKNIVSEEKVKIEKEVSVKKIEIKEKAVPEKLPETKSVLNLSLDFEPPATIIKVGRRPRGRKPQEKPIVEIQENVKEEEEPQLEDLIPVSKIDKNQVVAEAQLTELFSQSEKKPYSGRGRGRGRGGRRPLNATVESDRKKQTRRLGLDIDEGAIIDEEADQPVVRQSRRIAQLKIKEEAERRKLEEIALQKMKEEAIKKKKKEQDDYVPSPASVTSDSDDDYKKSLEKKKKVVKKKANQAKWHSGTGTSESDEKDEEEEEDGLEPEYVGSPLFKSDHEFSPESDLEDDSGVPTKMARTVRKDPEDDDDFDENPHHACQKCSKHDHPEWILLCDSCDKGYHCSCLKPVLFVIPEGDWFCPPCQHTKLLDNLNAKLDELDGMIEAKQKEELIQQRLIFNMVSTENILPEGTPPKVTSRSRSRSIKAKSSSSSDDNSSDNEPIYKLRKRRQANVSYRFNEYDDLINSAIKDEIAEMEEGMPEFDEDVSVTGAGNLGRGKDISTIIEADKEEKLRQLEAQNATKKEEKKDSDKSESEAEAPTKADESSDSEPIRPSGRQKIAMQKKKNRKLNTLDISSEDDGSDEDFQESSPDSEDSAESLSSGSESSMELELLRKKNRKAGITTRRSVRSRHKVYDEDFINDNDSDEFVEPPTKKKRKKEESDFSDFDESDDEDDDEEDLDSDDLCDDTDTGSDTSDWRSHRKKASSRKPPKRPTEKSSNLVKKKPKKKDDDEETPFRASSKKKFSDAKSEEECEVTRRTRGKKINFLEDYYDDSSDDGIKPGVKRPDTPPEEREMFIKKQEEIKRMLAAKNTEGAKEIATPKLEPLRVTSTEFEPMSPSADAVPGDIPSDSISTVPPQVIQTAKALDVDLHHKIKDTPDYSDPTPPPPPAPAPPATNVVEFDPENMTEDELAKMMEEESFVQHQLKLAGEAIRNKKLKEAEVNRKAETKEKIDVSSPAPLPTPPLTIPVYTPTHPMEILPEPSQMLPGQIRIPVGPQQLPPANPPHPMQHPVLRPTVPMPYPPGAAIRMPQGPQGLHPPMDQRNVELDPEHPSVKLTKAGLVPKKRGRKSKLELQAIAEAKARADVPYYPGPPGAPAQHPPVSLPPSSMPPSTHPANTDRASVLQAPNAIVTAAGEPVIPTTVLSVQGNPAATTAAKIDLDTSKKRGRRKKITPLRDSIPGGQLTTISGAMKGETESTTSNPILAERLEVTPATSEGSKKAPTSQHYPPGSSSGGAILSRLQQQMRPLPGPFGAQGLPGSRYFPSPHHLGHSSLNMSLHHLRANFAGTPTSTPGSSINNGLGERAPGIYGSPDQRGVPGPHGIFRGSGPMYPPGHGYQGQQSLLHHQLQSLDPPLGIRPSHSQEYQSPYLPPQFGGFYAPPSQTTQQQTTATTASSVPATSVTSASSAASAEDVPATTSAGATSTAQAPPYSQFETLKSSSPHENASHSYSNSPAHVEPGSSSEFSGLVSYFSSQQDDLES